MDTKDDMPADVPPMPGEDDEQPPRERLTVWDLLFGKGKAKAEPKAAPARPLLKVISYGPEDRYAAADAYFDNQNRK